MEGRGQNILSQHFFLHRGDFRSKKGKILHPSSVISGTQFHHTKITLKEILHA